MIRKTSRGHQVMSKDGKKVLSKDNLTMDQALKREAMVKKFKKLAGQDDGDGLDAEGAGDKD